MGHSSSMDSGINNLFMFRKDTQAAHPSCKEKRRPDRHQGLCRTKNIDTYLQYRYPPNGPHAGKMAEDVIRTSLQRDDGGSQLLFPFLVVEAKSEKGTGSFEKIEKQSRVPIHNALQLQWELFQAPRVGTKVPAVPLVWFLSYIGEKWRLYGAHMEQRNGRPTTVSPSMPYVTLIHQFIDCCSQYINPLWEGSITGFNKSLQLILIVDHIIDWARDTYRPNILEQLKSLTCSGSDDRHDPDSDIPSDYEDDIEDLMIDEWANHTSGTLGSSPQLRLLTYETSEAEVEVAPDFPEQQYSTEHGLVKDGTRIQSRLRGLVIERGTVESLFQSFSAREKRDQVREADSRSTSPSGNSSQRRKPQCYRAILAQRYTRSICTTHQNIKTSYSISDIVLYWSNLGDCPRIDIFGYRRCRD